MSIDNKSDFANHENLSLGDGEIFRPIEKIKSPEDEIRELEKKLSEKKLELEKSKSAEKSSETPTVPIKTIPSSSIQSAKKISKSSIEQKLSEETKKQVDELVEVAFIKGLEKAVNAAQKINNPYLLDAFHDTLVDKLYNDLLAKHKLKEL